MTAYACREAEISAGAIALGEADDVELDAYRLHLSRCEGCVQRYGGERDIERTMRRIGVARDSETWQPAPSAARGRARALPARLAWVAAVAVVIAGAAAWFVAPRLGPASSGLVAVAPAWHPFVVRQRVAPHSSTDRSTKRVVAAAPERKLIVVHNVVQLDAPPETRRSIQRAPAAAAATPPPARAPSTSDERSVADTGTTNVPAQQQHAESLALLPAVVRDVAPAGGVDAIVPHPARIAYYENAEGTTAVDVSVDERGNALKCTVTKPSGYLVLDESVCAAAMHARYLPRTVNGRALPGIYRDAFTFHAGEDAQQP